MVNCDKLRIAFSLLVLLYHFHAGEGLLGIHTTWSVYEVWQDWPKYDLWLITECTFAGWENTYKLILSCWYTHSHHLKKTKIKKPASSYPLHKCVCKLRWILSTFWSSRLYVLSSPSTTHGVHHFLPFSSFPIINTHLCTIRSASKPSQTRTDINTCVVPSHTCCIYKSTCIQTHLPKPNCYT